MVKVKALFYLPLRDSDGRDLRCDIEDVLAEIYVRFSGWTFQGYVKGTYRMADGAQAFDECEAYFVVLGDAEIPELENLLSDFKSKTLQEAIYLEIQRDVEVRFL